MLVLVLAVLFFALRPGSELDSLRADPALRPVSELDSLRADQLARWAPSQPGSGVPSVEADEEGSPSIELYGGVLPALGDRESATYVRTFLVPRAAALRPFEAARRAAQRAGWRLDYPDYITRNSAPGRTRTTVMGTKELPTGLALVHITLDTAATLPGASAAERDMNSLSVMLEHTR